jgi:hypothetical protein
MCRIENYLNNECKEILENLNDNMWKGNQFNYQIHGLLVINEYINVELMCVENKKYKHYFDIVEFKNAIICEHKVNMFFNEMTKLEIEYPNSNHHLSVEIIEIMSEMYSKLIEKLEYLSEEINAKLCNYCGEHIFENNLYGNVCAKHIPSYALFDNEIDQEDNYEDIYQEYTKEELRDIEYEEERRGLGYVDECYDESFY